MRAASALALRGLPIASPATPLRSRSCRRSSRSPRVATSSSSADSSSRWRSYRTPLPPWESRPTTARDLGGGVFVLEQPCGFLASAIGQPFPDKGLAALTIPGYGVQRCVVVRLNSGGLFVYSAIAPTAEALSLLRDIGDEVAHIVFPCTAPENWYYVPALADAFPEATISAAPSIFYSEEGYIPWAKDVRTPAIEKIKKCRNPVVLSTGDGFGEGASEVVADVWYAGPLYSEVTFVHQASGTLMCSDSLVGVAKRKQKKGKDKEKGKGNKEEPPERGGGGGGGGGGGEMVYVLTSPVTRRLAKKSRASARAWADGIRRRGGFDRVVSTRGSFVPVDADPDTVRAVILDEEEAA